MIRAAECAGNPVRPQKQGIPHVVAMAYDVVATGESPS